VQHQVRLGLHDYNSFPADPISPAAPIFAAGGMSLNTIIQALAEQYNSAYIDTFTPFVGNEAAYSYQDDQPTGAPFEKIPSPFVLA
jgi:hypothetical protein